jgi:hypothetical protein
LHCRLQELIVDLLDKRGCLVITRPGPEAGRQSAHAILVAVRSPSGGGDVNILAAIGLLLIGGALFFAARAGRIGNDTMELLARVAGIVSCLAAIVVLILPSAGQSLLPPPATVPPAGATATLAPGMQVYDSFDDNCINADRWQALAAWNAGTPAAAQKNGCWDLRAYGFEEHDGRLAVTCSNPSADLNRTYSLPAREGLSFSDLEVDVTVEDVRTGFGALGAIFNLKEAWAYYTLWYGGGWSTHTGHPVFETEGRSGAGKVVLEPAVDYPLPATITLGLHWDGTTLHFTSGGREVMAEPAQGYGKVLALLCGMGLNDNGSPYLIKGFVDEVRFKSR